MRKLITLMACLAMMVVGKLQAQEMPAGAWGNMPPLHVEGKHLVDPYGNNVVLHGVMDTPSPYFNSYRWGNSSSTTTDAKAAINYFDKLFTAITDTTNGAYCNLFRLHLDPCWTNISTSKAAGFRVEGSGWGAKYYDPHGNEVSGEANIYNFSATRLKGFLRTLYFPIAKKALEHGMYVIMRPPGVFPHTVNVGDYYNDYIMNVWDIVTQNDSIKKYAGQIMIELGNEPVSLKNAAGKDDDKALHDFFQPVIEKMRANGYTGVIWAPGTGWQGNYRPYGVYPITGANIGYAVHNYVGWYGGDDRTYTNSTRMTYANEFHNSVPVMDHNPIVITEVDWSPFKEGTGHYDEHGNWVLSNYGTWATGNTSKWGSAYKYMLDKYDNVSMTLSGTGCYIDIDDYINKKKVTPAFKTAMEANGLDPMEGSGVACFDWYKKFAQVRYARPDLSKQSDNAGLAVKEMKVGSPEVTRMVGQSIDFDLSAEFVNGLTSNIPAWLCEVKIADETVCEVKENGKIVGVHEGETEVTLSYTDPQGNVSEQTCKVTVLPIFSLQGAVSGINYPGTYAPKTGLLKTANGEFGGWVFDEGVDLSDYEYLVVNLRKAPTGKPMLCVSNGIDTNVKCYKVECERASSIKIDLREMVDEQGNKVNPADIRMVAFSTKASDFYFKEVFLSHDGVANGMKLMSSDNIDAEEYYTVSGQRMGELSKGLNVIKQRMANGEVKSVKVWVK